MSVTLKQIAELAGVSRGTVDRALHNRGRVSDEVAQRIRQIADELGYSPNRVGQALAKTHRQVRLGMIIQSSETPTMQIVAQGAMRAAHDLHHMGVEVLIRQLQSVDPAQELECIEELVRDEGIQGLALTPVNTPEICDKIDELVEQGIPVVTLNTDMPQSKRMCFVGQDSVQASRTAAGLLAMMMSEGGQVFILTGHLSNATHKSRCTGFCEELELIAPDIQLLPLQSCFDRDDYAYELTQHVLEEYPSLKAIYVAANGQHGVCEALRAAGLSGKVRVIAYDITPKNKEDLQRGTISILLDQRAHEQGYRPLYLLRDYIFSGRLPEDSFYYTGTTLKTKYNL